ncbi:two-component sensor histidine kinase [Cnuibacter physcomitrellae]|uniref:histidine kinase n=1 Tax=Cnuibacter physcomitrellae TaxID=1619308 RepID=A0A1X9LT59_9MICO|nr:HAMP domain-containing sensor histidine kinase [Cnuibacter physcomitrellae]ARJ07602.1 hypothetical protein B5808_19610 [Cnuibacter physcomitrellae]GGI42830.1 two-component sensor histidine kinase [Cnuibacter physcomitrellae]
MKLVARLSIRARMTIGTLLLATAFFTASAFVVHQIVEQLLRDSTVAVLESDIVPYETSILVEPHDSVDAPGEGQLIAVTDAAGVVVASTLPSDLTNALGPLQHLTPGNSQVSTGSATYAIAVESVQGQDGTWTVVAAQDQNANAVLLSNLTVGLVVGLAVLVLLFTTASWILTGAALRPVERLRRSAVSIVDTGSNDLLPVGKAHDEIAGLASTLNNLIATLRASAARERQMVSDASHELRTPVAVLQTQLELMSNGRGSDLESDLGNARRATARLATLVADLLELSRLDSAIKPGDQATVAQLIDEAGDAIDQGRFRSSHQDITVDLSVDVDVDVGEWVAEIRASTFGRIVTNLVGNSIVALGGKGAIVVTVTAHHAELILTVLDNGPGIDPAFLPHAFDRFSQQDSARVPSDGGAGLGLAIVRAAAGRAGGFAELSNQAGGGLLVTVRLPLRMSSQSA